MRARREKKEKGTRGARSGLRRTFLSDILPSSSRDISDTDDARRPEHRRCRRRRRRCILIVLALHRDRAVAISVFARVVGSFFSEIRVSSERSYFRKDK